MNSGAGTHRLSTPTRASRVTFFEDRAEVERRAVVNLPQGPTWLTLTGVSLAVDDSTVVARVVAGNATSLGTRVLRQTRLHEEATAAELAVMEAALREARRTRMQAEAAWQRVQSHAGRVDQLMTGILKAAACVPGGENNLAGWAQGYEQTGSAATQAVDDLAEAKVAVVLAARRERQAEGRLAQGRQSHPRYEAAVELQLEASTAQEVTVEIVYRVPCALWRPEHTFRLRKREAGGHELQVRTHATAWQNTGEEWDGIPCRFSTARPARSATPPLLTDDVVQTRKKSDAERKAVVVEARDQTVQAARLDRGIRAVEEMPGVEDGGEPQWFAPSALATIPSDGHPLRVEIGTVVLPCEVDRVSYPELGEAVHLRATATWSAPYPLLAGPAWIARETELAGRTKTKFVARGEPFEIGLGPEDALRVRRMPQEKRDTTPVIGTQKIYREVKVYISNFGAETKRLKVIERFPVSELEAVTVALVSSNGAHVNARDGFASYDMTVEGNATKSLTFSYRIEAGASVVLPF